MRQWNRWQDWVALVAGAYAALCPIWTDTDRRATWTMVVLGVVTALVSLWALARRDDAYSEGAQAVLGVLLFIAPWVMGFADITAMATTAWVVGAVVFIVGAWALAETQRTHRGHRGGMATSH